MKIQDEKWEIRFPGEHRLRHENFPFDIDVWYPLLKGVTFKSYFLPLSLYEAKAIVKHYKFKYLKRETLNYSDILIINRLTTKIDNFIKSNPGLQKGCFVRLCGRSPKDGDPLYPKKIQEEYEKQLKELSSQGKDIQNPNTKINAIAKVHWLKVRDGPETMSLLLSSERVYYDLLDWIKYGGKEELCFREWDEGLTYGNEFRAFVYDKKLRVITQYDHFGKYDELITEKEKLKTMITEYWKEKISPLMKVDDYVIDFGYVDDKIIMIELSPFRECTGTSLYRWDRDKKVLRNGNGEIRIAEKEVPGIQPLVEMWEDRWEEEDDYRNDLKEVTENWGGFLWRNSINLLSSMLQRRERVFVCSVMKKGFWYHQKFLSGEHTKFVGEGEIRGYEIGIDENGMGWLTESEDRRVKGEVYELDRDDLRDIKYFCQFCTEKVVEIIPEGDDSEVYSAKCFVDNNSKYKDKVSEYTLENEKEFNSIGECIKKQEKYLEINFKY